MTRTPKFLLLLSTALLPLAPAAAQFTSDQIHAAEALQDRHPTLDNHLDIPFGYGSDALDAGKDGSTQFDLVKAARGHLHGAVIAIFVPQNARTPAGYAEAEAKALDKLKSIQTVVAEYPTKVAIAHSPAELTAIEASGKFAIIPSILNGNLIGKDLAKLDQWQARGVQIFGFTHAGNNDLADSARPNLLRGDKLNEHGGLSPLGREAVKRLNDLGIVIDVSQITGDAVAQILALSRAPVVASHSNARAIIDHPRNLDDNQLRAIAAKGGVVAINAYSSWVRPLPQEAVDKLNAIRRSYGIPEEKVVAGIQPLTDKSVPILSPEKFEEYSKLFHEITLGEQYRATLKDYVDQIDHVVKVAGIDHVGISSDFNHGGGVTGWNDVGESANVTAELLARGYTEADIAKLWGGNFLRVWAQAQALATHKAR
jgi:microsomal dipeptidase-like Zn-dependent dipeptidase